MKIIYKKSKSVAKGLRLAERKAGSLSARDSLAFAAALQILG
jgi:hypothetical protein